MKRTFGMILSVILLFSFQFDNHFFQIVEDNNINPLTPNLIAVISTVVGAIITGTSRIVAAKIQAPGKTKTKTPDILLPSGVDRKQSKSKFQKLLLRNKQLGLYILFFLIGGFAGFMLRGTTKEVIEYIGYPTFGIMAVTQDQAVTIQAVNFIPNDTYNVRMNYYGTTGYAGQVVDTITAAADGSLPDTTYAIPAFLHGQYKIAIQLESPTTGYYTYNWFYNNTTSPPAGDP